MKSQGPLPQRRQGNNNTNQTGGNKQFIMKNQAQVENHNLDGLLVSKKVEPRHPFATPSKLPVLKDERTRIHEQDLQDSVSPVLAKKNSLRMPLPPNSDVKVREMNPMGRAKQAQLL